MKKFWFLNFCLSFLVVWGCTKEDLNLVNPPSPSETIRFRFFNAVNSLNKLQLDIDGKVRSQEVSFLSISDTIVPPPIDSLTISVFNNEIKVYQARNKVRLIRDTRYMVVAGESFNSDGVIDSIMILYSTIGLPKNQYQSYFKFVNLVKDSSAKFSLVEGCPNGKVIVQSQSYLSNPFLRGIGSGEHIFSIMQEKQGERTPIGLYSINFEEDKEYTLILVKDSENEFRLFRIWDYDDSPNPLDEVQPLMERSTQIRVANFANVGISVKKLPNHIISANLDPLSLSSYISIPSCESNFLDSIEIAYPSGLSYVGYSFEVGKKYTVLLFGQNKIEQSIVLLPVVLRENLGNRSLIRVVNALRDSTSITLSIGGRSSSNNLGYVAGEILASNLKPYHISEPVVIDAGYLPLTLFSTTEPSYLLKPAFAYIEQNKSYIIVLFTDENGNSQLCIIEDDKENDLIKPIDQGFFVQILNVQPYLEKVELQIPNLIDRAQLYYKQSFTTVLPFSADELKINKLQTFKFFNDSQKRGLFIISGDSTTTEIFSDISFSMGNDHNTYRRRFFNACKDVPSVTIKSISETGFPIVSNLAYGNFSPVDYVNTERRLSLFLINDLNGKLLNQFNDVYLTLGKNFTLVVSGSLSKGFSMTVIQEY